MTVQFEDKDLEELVFTGQKLSSDHYGNKK